MPQQILYIIGLYVLTSNLFSNIISKLKPYRYISRVRNRFFRNRKGRLDLLEEMQFHVSLERHVVDRGILFRWRSHIKHFVNLT